jgi:hypothetical protein
VVTITKAQAQSLFNSITNKNSWMYQVHMDTSLSHTRSSWTNESGTHLQITSAGMSIRYNFNKGVTKRTCTFQGAKGYDHTTMIWQS